ncbi:MAG TPA: hypothetical protein VFF04_04585 [Candidatus Babeliales bacterium]|nr:hypothetical protein [Candidatus Babeliales bacterium]
MPGMPRIPGKGKKIAYKILGIPINMQTKRTRKEQKVNQRLIFEETQRAR